MKRWIAILLFSTAPVMAQDAEPELDDYYEEDGSEYEAPEPIEPTWTRADADRAVRESFESKRLAFCNDPEYRVPASERWLCDLAPAARARCPALESACKNPSAPSAARAERRRRRTQDRSEQTVIELPSGVAALVSLAFWALIIAGAVALVAAIIKHAFGREREEEAARTAPDAAPGGEGEPGVRRVVETDVERLLARARAAAARGNHHQGVADAYAALLRHLDAEGLVHLHPSATNGDFVRGLREHPDVQRGVRDVVSDVDRLQFGAASATPELFDRVLRRVMSLVARGAAATTIALFAIGCTPDDDLEGRASKDSPAGFSVLLAALEDRGASVQTRIEPLDTLSDDVELVLVLDDLEPEEWSVLMDWVGRGGLAVIGIDPEPASAWLGVRRSGTTCAGPFRVDELPSPSEPATVTAPISPTLLVDEEDEDAHVIVRCAEAPIFVDVELGMGRVLVLDDALLTNASLAASDNAYVVLAEIGAPEEVQIIDQWTGSGTETPFAAVRNARLVPALAQLFALLLLAFLARGWPFGRLREPPERARRVFADHVRALGVQYAKARASRLVLGVYAGWALDRLKGRALPSSRSSLLALAEAIAARTGRDEREIVKLLLEAEAARDESARIGSPAEDLALMKQLESLLGRSGGDGWTSTGSRVVSKS